jgi:hypothetical protein
MHNIVSLDRSGKQAFRDWAQEVGVEILYDFHAFSGLMIDIPVRALPGLLEQQAITGVLWRDDTAFYSQDCW